jgi:cytochrome c553
VTSIALALFLGAVSYSSDVAPLMAFRCSRCHGDQGTAGSLDTRTWAGLRQGVTPGDPDASPVIEYVEGRRGAAHRMPLGEPPLSPREIAMLREWIAAGAPDDAASPPEYQLELPGVRFARGKRVRISAASPLPAYLVVELREREGGRLLHREAAAGTRASWDLAPEKFWPRSVRILLRIAFAPAVPEGAALCAGPGRCAVLSASKRTGTR